MSIRTDINRNIREIIEKQALRYDSFYLYEEEKIHEQIQQLQENFTFVEFLYSIKSNPARELVQMIISNGLGVDAASLNEVKLAQELGVGADKILYSAPGKSRRDIEESMEDATIIADSIREIYTIQELACKKNIHVGIGVRLNPDFTLGTGQGGPSKFGIDTDQALKFFAQREAMPNITICGIHVHIRCQELQHEVLEHYYQDICQLAHKVQQILGNPLKFINMGSGIGIPYDHEKKAMDLSALGAYTDKLVQKLRSEVGDTRVMIETGRFLVGQSGCYVTKVMDRKISKGKTYIILNNTLNGFMRPCLEQMVLHYTSEKLPGGREPLFTQRNSSQYLPVTEAIETETVTLVGNLCTAADVVAEDITLPKLMPGDLVVMTNAGSYGATLSPMKFSSQEPPAELLLRTDRQIELMNK